jgi:tRNA(Ile)-lysidine synthase
MPSSSNRTPRPEPERRPPAVAKVLERLTATVRRHDLLSRGSTVVVAVSGGQDSVCLLHSLHRLRRLFGIELVCFHFDHRLRSGSPGEALYVLNQAARLDVPFVLRKAASRPASGDSVEAWARGERYTALREVVESHGGGRAAVGHTQDDQAETVLLALVRGGGLDAVSGMAPFNPPVVRPLLDVTREETGAFCRSLGLRPRHDPMNDDPAFLRVAVRTTVIPALEAAMGRNVRATLARTASLLQDDAAFLRAVAADEAPRTLEGLDLKAERLAALPRAVASRVVRAVLLAAGLLPEQPHVVAVLDLATARVGTQVELPGGLLARRVREYVRVLRPSPEGSVERDPPPAEP